jgi:hypothetical protein
VCSSDLVEYTRLAGLVQQLHLQPEQFGSCFAFLQGNELAGGAALRELRPLADK